MPCIFIRSNCSTFNELQMGSDSSWLFIPRARLGQSLFSTSMNGWLLGLGWSVVDGAPNRAVGRKNKRHDGEVHHHPEGSEWTRSVERCSCCTEGGDDVRAAWGTLL